MTSFTDTFGGSAISPAQSSYQSITLIADTQFYWPAFSDGNANVISRFMRVTASTAGLNIRMPDASLASNGYDTIIYNAGINSLNVISFTGTAIATVAPGTAWYVLLTNNATQNGAWLTVQFGAGSSSAQASSLAGAGLIAVASLLNLNLMAQPVSSDFGINNGSLSILYNWVGGVGNCNLPPASSVDNGFFFMIANEGSGDLTVNANGLDTIDRNSTSVFGQGQSAFIVSSGSGGSWSTVGKGNQLNFAFTLLNKNVAGNTDVILTSIEAQNVIQIYTGLLTGDIHIIVPNTVQLYIVNNATTGLFTLAVKTAAGTGITIPQSATSILYCDGINVLSAFSFVPVSSTFAGGTAPSPGINWSGDTSTGFYQPSVGQVGVALSGKSGFLFTANASSINRFQSTASAASVPLILSAVGTDGNISIEWLTKGTGTHIFQTGGGIQAKISDTIVATNWINLTGAATGNSPILSAQGTDASINLTFTPKGAGLNFLNIGAQTPKINLSGSTSGVISLLPQAAAGTYNFNFPTTAGTTGQVLTSAGGIGAPMTWTTPSGSGVTSITAGAGLAGGVITTTGTISLATQTDNTILANISGGVAVPLPHTITEILNLLATTKGMFPYLSATSVWSGLAIGTTGQVLTVAAGLPAWATLFTAGQYPGTTTNDDAAAGNLGQYVESLIDQGSAVALTNSVATNMTSIAIPSAGDWLIWAQLSLSGTSTTTVSGIVGTITTTTAGADGTVTAGTISMPGNNAAIFNSQNPQAYAIPARRIKTAGPITVYLAVQVAFGVSTCSAFGGLYASRRR